MTAGFVAVSSAQSTSIDSSQVKPLASDHKKTSEEAPDIIVTGVRDSPYPVKVESEGGMAGAAVVARGAAADARLFARCIKAGDAKSLRDLADGLPNGGVRAAALDRIVRDHKACYPGYVDTPMGAGPSYGECHMRGEFVPVMDPLKGVVAAVPINTVCQAFYDRGALIEKVLEVYAPDLTFTTAQLMDAGVLARFHAREDRFDKRRSKGERVYAAVAACLVAVHPELALQYPKSVVNGEAEAKLRNALIGTTPQCVGGAKKVSVDPSEFRVFIADAIYSWAVALRGGDSLIPAAPARPGR